MRKEWKNSSAIDTAKQRLNNFIETKALGKVVF
jgi:hypothetical protein